MKDGNLVVRSGTNCPDGSIVSFGDLQIDIAHIKSCRSPSEVPGFLEAPGGAPANVAIAVARLGGKAAFVGKLDDDEVGPMLTKTLGANYVRTLSAQGGDMLPLIRSGSAKVFHYGSINLIGEPCREAHLEAMTVAKDAGLLLSYDPNLQLQLWPSPEKAREQIMSIWEVADLIKVSDVEFEFLTESNEIDDKSAMSMFFPNLKLLLVFLEDLSCRYYTKNFRGEVEAFRVDTVDITGAGDSFVGALLCKIVDDQSILEDEQKLRDVLKFANACAAFTTTKKGAVLAFPTKNDALSLIGGA